MGDGREAAPRRLDAAVGRAWTHSSNFQAGARSVGYGNQSFNSEVSEIATFDIGFDAIPGGHRIELA